MKLFLIILFINIVIFTSVFLFCACKVASIADESMEKENYKKSGGKWWNLFYGNGNCFLEIATLYLIKIKIKLEKF